MAVGLIDNTGTKSAKNIVETQDDGVNGIFPDATEKAQAAYLVSIDEPTAQLIAHDLWLIPAIAGDVKIEFFPRTSLEKYRYVDGKTFVIAYTDDETFYFRYDGTDCGDGLTMIIQEIYGADLRVQSVSEIGTVPTEQAVWLVNQLKDSGFTRTGWAKMLSDVHLQMPKQGEPLRTF